MYKKLFNFTATLFTLLTANLVTGYITDKLISYKWQVKPLRFTLISMGIIALIFFPLFTWLQQWIDSFSRRFVKAGHNLAGRYLGLLFMFVIGLFVLMCFYAHVWYGINVLKMITNGSFIRAL
ncbi:MAG TPA: hypothetical protein VK179_21085 [Bacteroidales bacterium]|nr:hypothetical protein [Bacteroidales bacterium]